MTLTYDYNIDGSCFVGSTNNKKNIKSNKLMKLEVRVQVDVERGYHSAAGMIHFMFLSSTTGVSLIHERKTGNYKLSLTMYCMSSLLQWLFACLQDNI